MKTNLSVISTIVLVALLTALFGPCNVYALPVQTNSMPVKSEKPLSSVSYAFELVAHLGGEVTAVTVQDQLAVVGVGSSIVALDVSDPTHPTTLGQVLLPAAASDISISGAYAYVTAGEAGLRIIDISDPVSLREVGAYESAGASRAIEVVGETAYVAQDVAGLLILDVSDPTHPSLLASYWTPMTSIRDVAVLGNYAYLVEWLRGLQVMDISDPAHPIPVSHYSPSSPTQARGVFVQDNYVYLAGGDLEIIDISIPSHPILVGEIWPKWCAERVFVSGNYAYIAESYSGLTVVDVTNPASPLQVTSLATFGYAEYVHVASSWAYLVDSSGALSIIDVSNPSSPTLATTYWPPADPQDMEVVGNLAYIASTTASLHIVDISNPASPVWLSTYAVQYEGGFTSCREVRVIENLAYIFETDPQSAGGILRILDVSDPYSPSELSAYPLQNNSCHGDVSGHFAFVGGADAGEDSGIIRIIDISNPSHPTEAGLYHLPIPFPIKDVYIAGDFAFVWGIDRFSIAVINISVPTAPQLWSIWDIPFPFGAARDIYVSGNYAYVSTYDFGLQVLDVSNPALPQRVGHTGTSNDAQWIHVMGSLAFVAGREWQKGLEAFDISNPSQPKSVAKYEGIAGPIATYDNYILVADHGLSILQLSPTTPPNTPVGNDVSVEFPEKGLAITFGRVMDEGNTTLTMSTTPPGAEPSGFQIASQFFDIQTTAQYDHELGIDISVVYDDTGLTFEQEQQIALLHYEQSQWVDCTISRDTIANVVTGHVASLSWFVIAIPIINVPPVVGSIMAPAEPVQVNSLVKTEAAFVDLNVGDNHTALWDWGDGNTSEGVISANSVFGTHVYEVPGVYTLRLTVMDSYGAMDQAEFRYLVVYNPQGGFVTGGGWLNSPVGAYAPNPLLSGKAIFGFVAKYQKGATVPTGITEFQFLVADLNFRSSNYEWLVIAGPKAKFKGTGTINGIGNYGFMVTAIDGQLLGGGGKDRFRIKIWDRLTDQVIYDNQMGVPEDQDAATEIEGGSIIIHAQK